MENLVTKQGQYGEIDKGIYKKYQSGAHLLHGFTLAKVKRNQLLLDEFLRYFLEQRIEAMTFIKKKRVFCWLPQKVYLSKYYQDGFVWLGFAWLGEDRKLYRSYNAE